MRGAIYAGLCMTPDIFDNWRTQHDLDPEDFLILSLVVRACMATVMDNPIAYRKMRTNAAPPEEWRGAVRRIDIMKTSGIPAETARRKIDGLIARGLVEEHPGRLLRARQGFLADPNVQKLVLRHHEIIMRYLAALKRFGVKIPE